MRIDVADPEASQFALLNQLQHLAVVSFHCFRKSIERSNNNSRLT